MKRTLILLLVIISCKSHKAELAQRPTKVSLYSEILGKVYKIDSIENYYLVYISSNNYNYKIVSKMKTYENCNKLELDSVYLLKTRSLLMPEPKPNQASSFSRPVNYSDF